MQTLTKKETEQLVNQLKARIKDLKNSHGHEHSQAFATLISTLLQLEHSLDTEEKVEVKEVDFDDSKPPGKTWDF